jgi:tryptophanyl-tRNA synthetase
MIKKRILTGDRPTGRLHLGHYVGSLKNRVALQDQYETFILIADVQALTDHFDHPEILNQNIKEVVADYVAVGIDPEKCAIFVQSLIPEIAELALYYLNLVTLSRLQRNPTVKDEIKQKGMKETLTAGFLTYPVHQAADITIFNAELVPVGVDQLPMIEQTVEIVRSFNTLYGTTLIEPQAKVGDVPRLPGIDGKAKMSKTLNNAIYLSDDSGTVVEKVRRMFTDPSRIHPTDPGHVEGNPVFTYHDLFNPNKEEVADLKARYEKGTVSDVTVKERLSTALNNEFLMPIRQRRDAVINDEKRINDIIVEGTRRARTVAQETMRKVRQAMKINYSFSSNV